MGQKPINSGSNGSGNGDDTSLVVTDHMIDLWNKIEKSDEMFRRVLVGPVDIDMSYLSYFLVAKAYAAGLHRPVLIWLGVSRYRLCVQITSSWTNPAPCPMPTSEASVLETVQNDA